MSDVIADMKRPAVLGLRIQVTEFDVQVPLMATVETLQHQAHIYRSYQVLVFSFKLHGVFDLRLHYKYSCILEVVFV
jgi:GH35 family endo-1,4-beta-xylanase